MKKTIHKITGFIALSVSLISYEPVFATASQGSFLDKNEELPWHVGVKAWIKRPIKHVMKRYSNGIESVIGPFVEWKPVHGIGVQTGVMYSHNNLVRMEGGMFNIELKKVDCDSVKFQAISIPFSIQLYPGNDRQFVLHTGPRLMIPLSKAKQVGHGTIYADSRSELFKKAQELHNESDYQKANELEIGPHLTWDWGFAYNTKSGFVIGVNGIGLSLGYDFTKLLVKT